MCHLNAIGQQRLEEGVRFLGIGVIDGCKLPHGCWKLNSYPLEDNPVLLTDKLVSLDPLTTNQNLKGYFVWALDTEPMLPYIQPNYSLPFSCLEF